MADEIKTTAAEAPESRNFIHTFIEEDIAQKEERLAVLSGALDALSPLKVLSRGYAVVQGQDGTLLKQAKAVQPGERVQIRLAEGCLSAEILDRRE